MYRKSTGLPTNTPVAHDEFLDFDTLGLANLIKTKQISQLELLEVIIRRIETVNPTVNFMTNRFYERSRGLAGNISMETPFAGVPILLKDMIDVAGMPRTDGSNFPPKNIPPHNAQYVDGVERAGLNIVGMTNVPEFAGLPGTDNDRFGATKNPWNLDYYPYMSSGGSAVSVATGVVPMAHGTDGAGSNRLPSCVTGLLGMKPSRYRMLADTHDGAHDIAKTNQMISRTVRDSATAFHWTQDPSNGYYPTEKLIQTASTRRLRVGIALENPGLTETSAEVRSATESAGRLMESLGHTVTEVKYPVDAEALFNSYIAFFAGKTASIKDAVESMTGKSLMDSGVLTRFVAGNLVANSGITPEEIAVAFKFIESIEPVFDEYFKNYDLLLTPVAPNAGLRIDEMGADTEYSEESSRKLMGILKFTAAVNFAGCPAMSAPLTWNSEAGLPIGTHFVAARGNDRMLYELAYELEEAQPWRNHWAPHSLKNMI
jgi:amidase